MFRMTNLKVAGAIAAGALMLGAAGVYAANNGAITLTTAPKQANFGAQGPQDLVTLSGTTPTLEAFRNVGDCVSYFASNRDLALATSLNGTKLARNYHGKLVSAMADWCRDHVTNSSTGAAGPSDGGNPGTQASPRGRP